MSPLLMALFGGGGGMSPMQQMGAGGMRGPVSGNWRGGYLPMGGFMPPPTIGGYDPFAGTGGPTPFVGGPGPAAPSPAPNVATTGARSSSEPGIWPGGYRAQTKPPAPGYEGGINVGRSQVPASWQPPQFGPQISAPSPAPSPFPPVPYAMGQGMGGFGGMGQTQVPPAPSTSQYGIGPQSRMFGQAPGMKNRYGAGAFTGGGQRVGGGFHSRNY